MKKTITKYGTLSFEKFETFIEGHKSVTEIELSNYGEVFLNKDFSKILEFAHQNNIQLSILNGANLNTATEEQLESLVKYKVHILNVSIDGSTQETYLKYRVKGNLETVLKNINSLNYYKKKYNSKYPKLFWQYIVFQHNVHEIEEAKSLADSLNMEFFLKENWDKKSRIPIDNKYLSLIRNLDLELAEDSAILDKGTFHTCLQMWQKPQINWNGEVLGCCVNFWESYGNAFSDGLESVIQGKKYKNTQELLSGKHFTLDSPCVKCDFFKNNVIHQNRIKYLLNSPLRFLVFYTKKKVRKLFV